METHLRSVLKGLTWRAGGWCVTTAVVWVITGKPTLALSIGLVDTVIKLGAYYAHERVWLKVPLGRVPPPDYEI